MSNSRKPSADMSSLACVIFMAETQAGSYAAYLKASQKTSPAASKKASQKANQKVTTPFIKEKEVSVATKESPVTTPPIKHKNKVTVTTVAATEYVVSNYDESFGRYHKL